MPPMERSAVEQRVLRAVSQSCESVGRAVRPADRLVDDLGFDSLRMATLSVALEEEFDAAILLNDWIGGADDPSSLTVKSLVDHLQRALA